MEDQGILARMVPGREESPKEKTASQEADRLAAQAMDRASTELGKKTKGRKTVGILLLCFASGICQKSLDGK
jgi:hypothetical protein